MALIGVPNNNKDYSNGDNNKSEFQVIEVFCGRLLLISPPNHTRYVDNEGMLLVCFSLFHSVLEVHPEQKEQSKSCSSCWPL